MYLFYKNCQGNAVQRVYVTYKLKLTDKIDCLSHFSKAVNGVSSETTLKNKISVNHKT